MDISKPDLNMDQGFVRKPYARKKVIRRPDGTLQVVFEDVRTGKQVNPQGYTVLQSDNNTAQTNPQPIQGQSLANPNLQQAQKQDPTAAQEIIKHTGELAQPDTESPAGSNYFNKPGWMGWTSMIPGPLGFVGKMANLGANVNNLQAINEQRATLGFAENPASKQIGQALFDQNGYIGDVTTTRADGTKETAPVSFEATDKNQRTAYTPEEARLHEQLSNTAPATQAEQQAAIGSFNNQFPEQNKSFFGGLVQSAKGLFGNIFGSPPTPTTGSGVYTGGQSQGLDSNGFPSQPDKPDVSYSSDNSPDDRDSHDKTTNGGYDHPGLF